MLSGDERDGAERGAKVVEAYRAVYGPIGDGELIRIILFDLRCVSTEADINRAIERSAMERASGLI